MLIGFAREADDRFSLGYAGDTFNVAGYLARGGIETGFVTALGEDPYSDSVVALAIAEGIASDLMPRIRGRLPEFAVLEADASGARHSYEWRGEAPVRDLFELPHWGRLAEGLAQANLVYFSGITLSLYSNVGLGRFLATLEAIRGKGVKIAFDGNFRPRRWHGDLSRARTVFIEALKRVDIALPTYDDEAVLWGDPSPEATVARLQARRDRRENGPSSALLAAGGKTELIPVPEVLVRRGVKLGGTNAQSLKAAAEARERAEALRPIFAELAGLSAHAIAAELNKQKIDTPAGGTWHAVQVIRVRERLQRAR